MKNLKFNIVVFLFFGWFTSAIGQDTTFVLRNLNKNYYQAIFIDSNSDWKYFKNLKQFSMHGVDSLAYSISVQEEIKHYKKTIRHSIIDSLFPKVWYQLNSYQNRLYLYEPNDNGFNTNKVLSDSSLINFNMDGPYVLLLDSIKQESKTDIHLYVKSYYTADADIISIYILDWEKKIALFDYHNPFAENRYRLMVAAETSNLIPVIVNYSKFQKGREFQFESIDFKPFLIQLGLSK
jgi:hypothetical protein